MAKRRRSTPRHGRSRVPKSGGTTLKQRHAIYAAQRLRKEEVAAFDPHLLAYLVDSDGNFITDSDGNLIFVNEV